MVWIHKDDAWKLQSKKKHALISYLEEEPAENNGDWIQIERVPEGARKLGSNETGVQ